MYLIVANVILSQRLNDIVLLWQLCFYNSRQYNCLDLKFHFFNYTNFKIIFIYILTIKFMVTQIQQKMFYFNFDKF